MVGAGCTIAIDLPLTAGEFVCFPNCFIIQHPHVGFFKDGDSGSGVFIKKSNQQNKPLGIAFAVFKRTKQTAVCEMNHVLNAFDCLVYKK